MPEKIAALRVERRPLSDGKSHPKNPRNHPAPGSATWELLRESLAFDYFDPLVLNVRNGMWVAGDFRHKVMLGDGFTHADMVIVDYDEETHRARMIAANKHLGDWNDELLAELAAGLSSGALPASLAMFTEKDLAMLSKAPDLDDDTQVATELFSGAEKLAEKWKVQPGDLFTAGPHRILCGDCTVPANWHRLLADRLADMIWTDPPYNERDTTVVREPRGTGELHPTVKPLNLVARQIWNSSARGQTVLEPFGGSGTTILAAEKTGRRAVATELDPKYCAVILERLTLNGLSVEKAEDGP